MITLDYSTSSLTDEAISVLESKESLIISVRDSKKTKWFLWYLPYLLEEKKGKPPVFKALMCFIVLRKFHAVYGTCYSLGIHNFSYEINDDNQDLLMYFIRNNEPVQK